MGVYPGFTSKQFGRKNSSINYGIMFIGFNAAGLIGPIIMGRIYSGTGAYSLAFIIALVFALLGFSLTFVLISSIKNELYFDISTFALINGVDAVNRINCDI